MLGWIQGGKHFGFALEAGQSIDIGRDGLGEPPSRRRASDPCQIAR